MAQYRPEVEIHLPDGVVVKGRQRWANCLPDSAIARRKGLKGLRFTAENFPGG
jgi:hypothetical protein